MRTPHDQRVILTHLGSAFCAAMLLVPASRPGAEGRVHPDSMSRTRVVVEGSSVRVSMRLQSLSLIELMPRLDLDRDGVYSEAELGAGSDAIGSYLLGRWQLFVGAGDGAPLEGRVTRLALAPDERESPFDFQWMEAQFEFEAANDLETFAIESRLFLEANPYHRDFVSVFWHDEPEVRALLRADQPRFLFEPENVRRPGVFGFFARLGFAHILEGYDHLAFLLMLLVAAPRMRSLLGVVTAFTVAHSITLGFAALDPEGFLGSIPSRFVELAIALSIAYVACENLLRDKARVAWIEAFAFGLLHGLGFAGFLGDALAGESLVVTALFGFNLGVEAGQLAVVSGLALVFVALAKLPRAQIARGEGDGLVTRRLRKLSSVAVAIVAFYWFAERAGWTP